MIPGRATRVTALPISTLFVRLTLAMASLLLNAFMTKLILAGISSSRVKFWQWKDDILLIRHRIWSKQSRFKWKKLVTLVFAWSFLASKVPDWSVFVWACSWLVSFFHLVPYWSVFVNDWSVFRLCLFVIGWIVCRLPGPGAESPRRLRRIQMSWWTGAWPQWGRPPLRRTARSGSGT